MEWRVYQFSKRLQKSSIIANYIYLYNLAADDGGVSVSSEYRDGKLGFAGAALGLDSKIHSWYIPSSGVMRFSGSQSRHRLTKSTKRLSLQRSTCANDLQLGLRFLPREFGTIRGLP